MYKRKTYQDQLARFAGAPIVKVVTGMRRVGKSTMLKLYREGLLAEGSAADHIIWVDMELQECWNIRDPADLLSFVKSRRVSDAGKHHLFIDEVQEIPGWEKAVAALLNEGWADIHISGSNARLLSSELATLLTGRYVEIPINPLSYAEYIQFRKAAPDEGVFHEYLVRGGMPGLHHMERDDETVRQYLSSLVDSIVLKDVIGRYNLRDSDLVKRLLRFLADNSGKIFSAKRVVDFLKNERRSIGVETIYSYVDHLVSSYLVQRIPRYDLKGKKLLSVSEKCYFGDLGMKHALVGYRPSDINTALEWIVCLELRKRGYEVRVGKAGEAEVDFIAEKSGERKYFQVCYLLSDEDVVRREFGALERIDDNHPKYVLSMDRIAGGGVGGIHREYLPDFLLKE
jgi:predicted AAA+ superfamily ATPase